MQSTAVRDIYIYIRESVDSLCRDGADMLRPPYIYIRSSVRRLELCT